MAGLLIITILIGGLLIAGDWDEIRAVAGQAQWEPVVLALLFSAISYACISYSFARVSQLLGISMGLRDLTEIGFVSTVLNHIVQSGGVAGLSVRYSLMGRQGIPMKEVLAASIFHFYLTSLAMLAMLPVGFSYLLINAPVARGVATVIAVVTVLLLFVASLATLLLFRSSARSALVGLAGRFARHLTGRDVEPTLRTYNATLTQGVVAMRSRPVTVIWIMALIIVDWAASVFAFGYCLDALGPAPSAGVLVTSYVIGIMAGVLSTIPAGIGVQEGSMVGVLALLGMSLEQSFLASILFRGVYYLAPYIVSLGIYGRLLRQAPQGEALVNRDVDYAHFDVEPRLSSDGERRDSGHPESRPLDGQEGSHGDGRHRQRTRDGLSE